ncbi:MAG TPA: RnfABCDGE type electron transport complex subunit D [Candidatus Omnitrophota bacterium]|nr:RnfABCDGE type electron transport complex subunit D [Candidatus Omnitrophota bacterium]HPT39575.1 RnfABCDGE type electron transport complex subunit D [Candidatus Omnitrophota bacterium]
MQILKSIKVQLVIYLSCLAVFLAFQDKNSTFLLVTGFAVLLTLCVEAGALYFRTKTFRLTSSSIITGLIIGYVFSSDQEWWKILAACTLAILSKYLIVFKKKHIFNPAAFGIFLTLILFGAFTQWKGTYLWYILLPAGIYFARKFRKVKIVISYFLVALILFGIQAILQKIPLGHILGYFSYFYIFVMIIEPKTSPVKSREQIIFGSGIAVLIFILTAYGVRFDVELFSLLVLNMVVPLIHKVTPKAGGV